MTAKVLVDSRLHIPVKVVDADNIIKKMTHYEFENAVCKNCEFRSIRPSEECRSCSKGGLLDITVLAKYSEIKGKRYVSIPYGEMHRFEKTAGLSLKEVKFVNGTSRVPYDYKVKFTGKLREYQEEPFEKMFGELCGVFKAPPRSGKTVIGTAGACHSGFRTVIMADQKDFLDGFLETIEAMTNLPELEEKHGKKLYGFPKTLDDYKNFQIILVTYQSLISDSKNSKKRLKLLNENYGTLFIDEVHAANAQCFSKVVANLKMKYRFGLTATPKRKDCFTAGHKVKMSDGSLKNIEDIKPGECVVAWDHKRQIKVIQPVVEVHEVQTKKRKIKITHEHGTLICTEDHPIWSETRQCYVNAIDLTTEDVLKVF